MLRISCRHRQAKVRLKVLKAAEKIIEENKDGLKKMAAVK
jgi:hypothetical protein